MGRYSREKKPLTISQMKVQIEKIETRLETEALKFSEEKKLRDQIKSMKKEIKKAVPVRSSFRPKNVNTPGKASGPEYDLKDNISGILKQERLKRKISHNEFAFLISEKVSVVQKWESVAMVPKLDTARRVQRLLKVGLVKQITSEADGDTDKLLEEITKSSRKKIATLGDMIKITTRNR